MKRFVMISVVAVLMVGLLSGLALAASKVTVWKMVDEDAVETNDARAYVANGYIGFCNKTQLVNWSTSAEVAQWLELMVTSTEWRWYVRKPGTYFADCIGGCLKSNGDVTISFSGFGPLVAAGVENPAVNEQINTWYGYDLGSGSGPLSDDFSGWYAAELPSIAIPDTVALHTDGQAFKLWNMIEVIPCNSANVSLFSNKGTVTVTLASQKPWIDLGDYKADYNY